MAVYLDAPLYVYLILFVTVQIIILLIRTTLVSLFAI
jgi:hypothetical protein